MEGLRPVEKRVINTLNGTISKKNYEG